MTNSSNGEGIFKSLAEGAAWRNSFPLRLGRLLPLRQAASALTDTLRRAKFSPGTLNCGTNQADFAYLTSAIMPIRMTALSARNRWVVFLLLLCLAAVAHAAENKFERTLSVNGIVTLRISTSSGYVHVFRGPDGQVHVVGHVTANSSRLGSSLDAVAKVVSEPSIDRAGNIIRIGGRPSNLSIDYDVAAPRNTILAVQSGSGDVQVTDIRTVEAETASGEIRAQRLGADSELKTGSGTIEASDLDGPSVLQTGSGDIRASYSAPGNVTADTGSGSVSLRNVQGGLKVETGSGDLEIEGKPTGPWKVETGFGRINVDLGSSGFALDAETGLGTVTSDLPITVQRSTDKRHIVGKVNNGGPTVKVQTGSGDIRIK